MDKRYLTGNGLYLSYVFIFYTTLEVIKKNSENHDCNIRISHTIGHIIKIDSLVKMMN